MVGRLSAISEDLIDQIYEAAVLPALWPDVLGRIAALNGADLGGVLGVEHINFRGWTASEGMKDIFAEYAASELAAANSRLARGLQLNHPGFVTDHVLFSPEEMDADPYYKWARTRNTGWFCGTIVQAPQGDLIVFVAWSGGSRLVRSRPRPSDLWTRSGRILPALLAGGWLLSGPARPRTS